MNRKKPVHFPTSDSAGRKRAPEKMGEGCWQHVRRWGRWRLPVLHWVPSYDLKADLLPDAVAGTMLAVQQVAQGLAFAVLSSVHPVFGLYGALFPPIIYAIFGMGRHVATGAFGLTSLISAGAVERLVPPINNFTTNNNSSFLGLSDFEMQRIGVAAAVTFLGGIIQVALFVLNAGSTTFLLPEPVLSSMTTGAATHVVTSQVKYLLGIKMPYISGPLGMFYIYAYAFNNIRSVQLEALLLSLLSIVVLVVVKQLNEQFKEKIKVVLPVELLLMIATAVACYCVDMEGTYGLKVVGHIPKGIPPPQAPPMNVLADVIVEGFGVALVGYAISIMLAQDSAKKFNYYVNDNQEFLAHGLSNVVASFFFCIPNSAAMARTGLLYSCRAKTQVACLISSGFILVVIYTMGSLLYWLPMCVLASIIVTGLKGMLLQFRHLRKYWNVDKIDWVIWVLTYVVTISFAANVGLFFGVVFNIAMGIVRLTRAKTLNLINMKEENCKLIEDVQHDSFQKMKIVSITTPLFFMNAKKFKADVLKINTRSPAVVQLSDDNNKSEENILLNPVSSGVFTGEHSHSPPPSATRSILIFDCSGLTFFDYTGVSILVQIYMDFKNRNVDVLFVHCLSSLIKALQCSGLKHEDPVFFDSVSVAIETLRLSKACGKLNEQSEV
ncbi:anion exchange transporter [Rhinatrema bivittatum]|uniref:anion exchange transporter n=1 Tax=Rhinatrema bivittatum TaxID=194408 RepID=UPI00112AFC50|nr:anion exchange transporter [Rhinatrema bivittatum]